MCHSIRSGLVGVPWYEEWTGRCNIVLGVDW